MTAETKHVEIHDAEPEAWKGEPRPNQTTEARELFLVSERVFLLKRACDTHEPPYAGPDWARKTAAFSAAWAEWERLIERLRGSAK